MLHCNGFATCVRMCTVFFHYASEFVTDDQKTWNMPISSHKKMKHTIHSQIIKVLFQLYILANLQQPCLCVPGDPPELCRGSFEPHSSTL